MFRLTKINYAGNNAPKYERFSVEDCTFPLKAGVAVDRLENKIIEATYYPRYIVAKDYDESEGEDCLCYEVTENMEFKVELLGTERAELGRIVALAVTTDAKDAVEYNDDGSGRIIGIADDPKYVYVKFDRRKEYEEW